MITPEEERRIIETAKEEIMLSLPHVWSSLFVEMKSQMEFGNKFYEKHPEFKEHKDVVSAVINMIDGKNPAMSTEDKFNTAVPKIREVLQKKKGINMDVGGKPDTNFDVFSSNFTGNGSL